jgi:hypothetical protein
MKSFKEFMTENWRDWIPFVDYPGRKSYNPWHNIPGNPDGEVVKPPESNPDIKPSAHPGKPGPGRPTGRPSGNPDGGRAPIDVSNPFGR